ncbi:MULTISPECIES: AzlC family ABC transporter permease [unclassified Staphylococcus]|uniref:AzlC family ABC transporter permease n=1 Tax=unclassified Staphylococcus TaxID=91994 RepID=UPI0021D20EB1|nr:MULTISPECIES: AzlC family ABC transporter permease [unclassified Staphylococcus]UXR69613.1 AzlC family ABC transporter permease [Staphylococcus sp. IVB6246]UXR71656.1 AzlC family ABC transporter permease [Staphylococcus sp. IVB6240]UXR73930.1 AzlC family ABC transporter permease [Staphylococcus sp. IVB6238]UXR76252.1 AzlC family ABC transporter permease [Staphylococcus sp. IVB6233]UXR80450.1 AzlC family ABC transporter permease [Staphylococcus sp. IVB6218]
MSYQTFKQGVKDCIPTLLGYAGIGFSFGVVGITSGFNIFEIALLSILIYAGAAQFIVIALMVVHTPVWVIVLTALIVNSRMFLLSMTLAPSFKHETLGHRIGIGTLLTDETFGVAITPYSRGEIIGRNWMYGLNITAYLFWILTTILGAALGDFVSQPEMFGLDYAIIAMFVFLAAAQLEGVHKSKIRLYLLLILVVIVLMLVLSLFMPSYLAIMIASILTATLGMVIEQ